jgi:uncharacterized DUF497 family protein
MDYFLTQHSRDVLAERNIPLAWLERALQQPALIKPSSQDATAESRFVVIPEFGNRVLRVVVNKSASPLRVVSVYFDRTMKGKL